MSCLSGQAMARRFRPPPARLYVPSANAIRPPPCRATFHTSLPPSPNRASPRHLPNRACRARAGRRISRLPTGRARCAASSAASKRFDLEESRQRSGVLRFPGAQPRQRHALPRGDPRPHAGRELLLLSGFRDQSPGHLQAHRVHARQAGSASAAARPRWHVGSCLRTAKSGLTTPARVRCAFAPAPTARRPCCWRGEIAVRCRCRLVVAPRPHGGLDATVASRAEAAATSCVPR